MQRYLAFIRRKIFEFTLKVFLWVVTKVLVAWGKLFSKISVLCHVACFYEVWDEVAQGKPIDIESPVSKKIHDTVESNLTRLARSRDKIGLVERLVLPTNYAYWVARDKYKGRQKKSSNFVKKYHIGAIIGKYTNIQHYINYCALGDLEKLERFFDDAPSAGYWKRKVDMSKLPVSLQSSTKPRVLKSYLKKRTREVKNKIAFKNYLRIDFSLSDLTSFAGLSGTLILILGYLHVVIVNTYFGIPYQRYFALSDYVRNSVDAIDKYLLAALIAGAFLFFYAATLNSVILPSESVKTRSFLDRLNNWMVHFLGLSSLLALALVFIQLGSIEPSAFLIFALYAGTQGIGRLSVNFFANPVMALLLMTLTYTAIVSTVAGAIREVNRIVALKEGPPIRILHFDDVEYVEPTWRVIAITSDFVIMRRQSDGFILVRTKSDLKKIENVLPN